MTDVGWYEELCELGPVSGYCASADCAVGCEVDVEYVDSVCYCAAV